MSNDFLKRMLAAGEKHGAKPISNVVAAVKIEIGFTGYVKGYRTNDPALFQAYANPDDGARVATEVTAKIFQFGGNSKAVYGLMVTVPKANVLSFQSEWDKSRFTDFYGEPDDFEAIISAVDDLDLPLGEYFWCAYETPESPSAIKKGDKGKYPEKKDGVETGEMIFPRIVLPVEKFANEAAAKLAAGGSNMASSVSQWSERLRANHVDPDKFLANNMKDIQQVYNQMVETKQKPYEGAPDLLPGPLTLPKIKQYLAQDNMWACTTEDIDIVLEIPF